MAWIDNQDMASIYNGFYRSKQHVINSESTVLIQIFDINHTREFPSDYSNIVDVNDRHQFEFLDIESEEDAPGYFDDVKISDSDSRRIAEILVDANENGKNVIVHCFAGVSRSGAVVEAGISLGMQCLDSYRHPNKYILSRIKYHLSDLQVSV